jgi:hypothetical protein
VKDISVIASDNVGITSVNLQIFNPNSSLVYSALMYKSSGTVQSGTWTNDWATSCASLIGRYRVFVQVQDAASNTTPWTELPSFTLVPSTFLDKSAPVFVSGSVAPGPITVGQTIREISARFTDDIGISTATFRITDPTGRTVATIQGFRNTGTKIDGTYRNDWATTASSPTGRYTIYVEAVDEWQKTSGLKVLGFIDINPVSSAPTPLPVPAPGDAAMKVTPYFTPTTSRSGTLISPTTVSLKARNSATFLASTLFVSGNNSGLLSLGHLLEVSTLTPTVCSVTGVTTWDRTAGIFTRATINTLTAGTCSILWKFNGSKGRAATSTTMDVKVTP